MEHNLNDCRDHQRAILIKFRDHSRLHSSKLAVVERLFWQLGTCCSGRRREGKKKESMYGLSTGKKIVAVLEGWTSVEV